MSTIRTICVYCGSGPGTDPAFVAGRADARAGILAENGIGLVYGGGSVGLMGALANAVLDNGGEVTGIIPEFLADRERMMRRGRSDRHPRHARAQALMFERADAFVALPGGIGTLEELVEQLTWAQLGRHKKPILIANIDGFWDPLCALLDHMERARLHPRRDCRSSYLVADRVEDMLPKLIGGRARSIAGSREDRWQPRGRRADVTLSRRSACQRTSPPRSVAVGIADEGRVVALAVFRAQARRAVATCRRPRAPRHETHRPPRRSARAGRCACRCRRSTGVMLRRWLIQNSGYFLPKPTVAGRVDRAWCSRASPARLRRSAPQRREIAHRDGDVIDHCSVRQRCGRPASVASLP